MNRVRTDKLSKEQSALVQECARSIFNGFLGYNNDYRSITLRAKARFQSQNWYASQRDQARRIELYDEWVWNLVEQIKEKLLADITNEFYWSHIKSSFLRIVKDYVEIEFTKTYYNSITRRIFKTQGTNPLSSLSHSI